jgi:hypothetical protein
MGYSENMEVNFNFLLRRRLSVLPCLPAGKPLPSGSFDCFRETLSIPEGDSCDILEKGVAKRIEVAAVKVFSTPNRLLRMFLCNRHIEWSAY